jgi:hypothetical protein
MLIGAIFAETMAWVLGSSALINLLNCACKRPLAPNFFQFHFACNELSSPVEAGPLKCLEHS